MKTNIKNITKCVCFFLTVVCVLYGASLLVMPKDNSESAGIHYVTAMGYLAEPENSMDVLFLGDSLVYSGISPVYIWNAYGITSYDCSIPSEKFSFANEFCKTFLEKQSPKVVFLETGVLFRDLQEEDVATFHAQQVLSVFTYHNRWKSLTKRDLNPKIDYTYIEPFRGYRMSTKVNGAKSNDYYKEAMDITHVSKTNFKYLENLKKMCDEKGAKLVILSIPCQKNWNYKIHNGAEEAAEKLGLEYLDMNLLTAQDDGFAMNWELDSRDKGEHLNNRGAEKVSEYLGKYITAMGLTTDKRGTAGYESWNEAYVKLQNEIDADMIKNAMK